MIVGRKSAKYLWLLIFIGFDISQARFPSGMYELYKIFWPDPSTTPTTTVTTTTAMIAASSTETIFVENMLMCYDLTCNRRDCLSEAILRGTDLKKCYTDVKGMCYVSVVRTGAATAVKVGCNTRKAKCGVLYNGGDHYMRWTECCSTNGCNDNENLHVHDKAGMLASCPLLVFVLSAVLGPYPPLLLS